MMVQIFHNGQLVKTHAALDQGKRTDKSDYLPEKIAFQMRTPVWYRSQASEIGDACREVVDQLLEVNVLYRLCVTQGVLGLRKKYGETPLEAACEGHRGRRPVLPHHQGHPHRRRRDRSRARDQRRCRAAAFLHGPARLFATVATPDATDDDHEDQVHDEAEVEAR
ncbi:hypothetical protein [Streptomyces sp. NPDC003737]|uniref:hypothetical protein n=1 Tax=Streptomyces sp. NPDC003737 TaxID=3364685 RepID=UPI00367C57AF